jgi:hypothetical protein
MGWGSVAEAAIACGLPVPSWRNWERDGRRPRRYEEVCAIIADRSGCDFGWLLAGSRLRGGSNDTHEYPRGHATRTTVSTRPPNIPDVRRPARLSRLIAA